MIEKNRLLLLTINYTLVFTLLIFATGLWLFFISSDIKSSLEGALEVIVPHLFSISILAFIFGHFLLFIESVDKDQVLKPILFLYFFILLENLNRYLLSLELIPIELFNLSLALMVLLFGWLICIVWINLYRSWQDL